MTEPFFSLGVDDRLEALNVAASATGRPLYLLEKDIWVVWVLGTLFDSGFGGHLVFKGGTSLSKAYQAIRRFSEDIDLTYDIRALAPHLAQGSTEALPKSRSQGQRWTAEVRRCLPAWVNDVALFEINDRLNSQRLAATARAEGDKVIVEYEALTSGPAYVSPTVMLEFGARSSGEPWENRRVVCDAATAVKGVTFPEASPRVMRVERTFWEKATAIHVFCLQQRLRGDRFARHWQAPPRSAARRQLVATIR